MKLYKFRALGSCQDLMRAQMILETGQFWCSHFWELNDPMEGVYSFYDGKLTSEFIRKMYDEKSKHAICSFSGEKAFPNPIMWGYYANGFKGIAIEIRVGRNKMKKVEYIEEIPNITGNDPKKIVTEILTNKLPCWSHEDEFRYLQEGENGLHDIGKITKFYFGNPYRTMVNARDIQGQKQIKKYLCRLEILQQTAACKSIKFHEVYIDINGLVQPKQQSAKDDPHS